MGERGKKRFGLVMVPRELAWTGCHLAENSSTYHQKNRMQWASPAAPLFIRAVVKRWQTVIKTIVYKYNMCLTLKWPGKSNRYCKRNSQAGGRQISFNAIRLWETLDCVWDCILVIIKKLSPRVLDCTLSTSVMYRRGHKEKEDRMGTFKNSTTASKRFGWI